MTAQTATACAPASPFPFPAQGEAASPDIAGGQLLHDLVDKGAGPRRHARALYWMGWRITHIADYLGVPRTTLHEWAKAEKWAEAKPVERVEGTLEARLCTLINKDAKTGGD